MWAERIAPPVGSNVNLLGDLDRVVDVDAEIPNRAFDLRMSKQKLDRTEVAGSPIDQSGLRSAKRMSAILQRIEANACKPLAETERALENSDIAASIAD